MDSILVVNAGSSSVKFEVFAVDGPAKLTRKIKGQINAIGTRPRLRASGANGTVTWCLAAGRAAHAATFTALDQVGESGVRCGRARSRGRLGTLIA